MPNGEMMYYRVVLQTMKIEMKSLAEPVSTTTIDDCAAPVLTKLGR